MNYFNNSDDYEQGGGSDGRSEVRNEEHQRDMNELRINRYDARTVFHDYNCVTRCKTKGVTEESV